MQSAPIPPWQVPIRPRNPFQKPHSSIPIRGQNSVASLETRPSPVASPARTLNLAFHRSHSDTLGHTLTPPPSGGLRQMGTLYDILVQSTFRHVQNTPHFAKADVNYGDLYCGGVGNPIKHTLCAELLRLRPGLQSLERFAGHVWTR